MIESKIAIEDICLIVIFFCKQSWKEFQISYSRQDDKEIKKHKDKGKEKETEKMK